MRIFNLSVPFFISFSPLINKTCTCHSIRTPLREVEGLGVVGVALPSAKSNKSKCIKHAICLPKVTRNLWPELYSREREREWRERGEKQTKNAMRFGTKLRDADGIRQSRRETLYANEVFLKLPKSVAKCRHKKWKKKAEEGAAAGEAGTELLATGAAGEEGRRKPTPNFCLALTHSTWVWCYFDSVSITTSLSER